ncbi:MAG: imidazole glycerol phosphate synthase cyclase subunit [Candidatus Manganitrophus sp.]|nr:imidazole glycerol phosphate synthase cyclase subunit [Candidatus Manganitrophus sp.]WDT72372.1 MAG: imidazole glycerol phosphate synthase cyclase subunit [Candidatus Manganitrophus sp.]WDT80178.1 MAG: imidazole glycerol phosphate synthase cyclase subunit [Candidatus Manganitrophus sp.]
MLKRRLIPKLQMKTSAHGGSDRKVLVTTIQFKEVLEIGDPVSQAKIYEAQAADELIFLDLDASSDHRKPILEVIRRAAEEIFMPFTVGGGVRSIEDFRDLLSSGADKVSINTAAVETPDLINNAAEVFGAQCVVLSIDCRSEKEGGFRVWINGGRIKTDLDPVAWAIEGEKRGAGEILLTSIDCDGMRCGLDLELTRRVAEAVSIPVIASGGCGAAAHFVEGFQMGRADAVAAGTYFCFKDENPMQTRSQIRNAGIPIRMHR